MTFWTDRLDELAAGNAALPPVTERLKMGTLTRWEKGYVLKEWPLDEVFLSPGHTSAHKLLNSSACTVANAA